MLVAQWVIHQVSRTKGAFSAATLTLASLILIQASGPVRERIRSDAVSSVLLPIQMVIESMHLHLQIYRRNVELNRENTRLLTELSFHRDEHQRLARISKHLEVPVPGGMRGVVARVVVRDPVREMGAWVINRGARDGVTKGTVAVSPHGLVGMVAEVRHDQSFLHVLGHPSLRVAVVSNRSRHPGILESDPLGGVMAVFDANIDLRTADTLLTWGAGGIFPGGVPVAVLGNTELGHLGVLRTGSVWLLQPLHEVEEVLLLLPSPDDSILKVTPDTNETAHPVLDAGPRVRRLPRRHGVDSP